MLRFSFLFAFLTAGFYPGAFLAHACAYNVRDVGFVDLGSDPYRFQVIVDDTVSPALRSNLEDLCLFSFMETNVEAAVLDADDAALSDVVIEGQTVPFGIFRSPEGQVMRVPVTGSDAEARIEGLVHSPMRERIRDLVLDHYAAVLIVQSTEELENQRAEDAALNAITLVEARMNMLPKAIAKPPVLLTLLRDQIASEQILLWSLGLETLSAQQDTIHAVVLYGRARLMGRVLSGDEVTPENIGKLLGLIGEDCECGLDRSWMQDTMLPLRWDSDIQEKAAALLDFDPENPMVKTEISMALSKGTNSGSAGKGPSSLGDLSFAYTESVVQEALPEARSDTEVAETPSEVDETPLAAAPPSPVSRQFNMVFATLGALLLVAVVGTVMVVLRARG